MKNLTNYILILAVLMVIVSCSTEEENEPKIDNSELVSVTLDFYYDNELYAIKKYFFQQSKLVRIDYTDNLFNRLDGRYDIISYENGLISKIDNFNSNDVLAWTFNFDYDADDRLINYAQIPFDNVRPETKKLMKFSYEEGQILETLTYFDQNNEVEDTRYETYHLDANNLIKSKSQTKEKIELWRIEYANNSPNNLFFYDYDIGTFRRKEINSFLNKRSSDEYQLNKYAFGKHWKNNALLCRHFNSTTTVASILSMNYLDGIKFHDSQGIYSALNIEYEFDSNDKLTKQTRAYEYYDGATPNTTQISYEYLQ